MKNIIIIGGGIAGLSAGCYAQMNGYQSTIYEMHSLPGGLCTSWQRKGYQIDGSVHWLVGSKKTNVFHRFFEELKALENIRIIDHPEHMKILDLEKNCLTISNDLIELEAEFIKHCPNDKKLIKRLLKDIRLFSKTKLYLDKPREHYNFFDGLKYVWGLRSFILPYIRYSSMTMKEFADKLKSEFFKKAFPLSFYFPEMSMLSFIFTISFLQKKEAGYPIGGSLNFSKNIEKRFKDLGGKIRYRQKAVKILEKNGKTTGVELKSGEKIKSDIVISACDGYSTLFKMLDKKFIPKDLEKFYKTVGLFPGIIQLSFGINEDFSDKPHNSHFELKTAFTFANTAYNWINVQHYCFDKTAAPAGKSLVVVLIKSDYDYWDQLDQKNYLEHKKIILQTIENELEFIYPGFISKIEMRDVATPITYFKYTGNRKGSMQGWFPSEKTLGVFLRKKLASLKNFYMAGHWVEPGGGIPVSVLSGRNIIQMICREDKKTFVSQ